MNAYRQAVRRRRRDPRRVADGPRRRDSRAGRRKRRRQNDADEHPLRPAAARRRRHSPARRTRYLRRSRRSDRAGIGMVHQHFKLAPSFTVAENIILGAEPRQVARPDRPGQGRTRDGRTRPSFRPRSRSARRSSALCPSVFASGSRSRRRSIVTPRSSSSTSRPRC